MVKIDYANWSTRWANVHNFTVNSWFILIYFNTLEETLKVHHWLHFRVYFRSKRKLTISF